MSSSWVFETVLAPLLCFACVGIGAVYWTNGRSFKGVIDQDIKKITAKGKIRWTQITASAWIHGTGAWVLFAPPETGWVAGVWGVIAYAIGCGLPGLIFAFIGPKMARATCGYSFADWVRTRYSKHVYHLLLVLSCFFLFIVSCSELTGLLDAFDFLLNNSPVENETGSNGPVSIVWIPALVVIVANLYACVGGLEVSLITDRAEGLFCALFLGMCLWVITTLSSQIEQSIEWTITTEARNAAVTLILGCWINEMINQTQWQRVFSAKSDKHLQYGASIGSLLIVTQIATFGLSGVFIHQLYREGKMPDAFDPNLSGVDSFFWGLFMAKNSRVVVEITLAITCCIVCSTMDTLVNAYTSLLIKPMERQNVKLKWIPFFTLSFTLPAIGVATARISVISLFMTINVIAVSVVPGIFWGAIENGSSTLSVIVTSTMGIMVVPVYGAVLEGSVKGAFGMFLFPRGSYDTHSAMVFLICTAISAVGTPIVAYLHRHYYDSDGYFAEWKAYTETVELNNAISEVELKSHDDVSYYTYASSVSSTKNMEECSRETDMYIRVK